MGIPQGNSPIIALGCGRLCATVRCENSLDARVSAAAGCIQGGEDAWAGTGALENLCRHSVVVGGGQGQKDAEAADGDE